MLSFVSQGPALCVAPEKNHLLYCRTAGDDLNLWDREQGEAGQDLNCGPPHMQSGVHWAVHSLPRVHCGDWLGALCKKPKHFQRFIQCCSNLAATGQVLKVPCLWHVSHACTSPRSQSLSLWQSVALIFSHFNRKSERLRYLRYNWDSAMNALYFWPRVGLWNWEHKNVSVALLQWLRDYRVFMLTKLSLEYGKKLFLRVLIKEHQAS